ncbi:hypothetical protein E2C01_048787 [Portunus trituberculatus]|uniref:Uncharacterized protein n=1 Tax=Portunus trituberculatus TaxID=210409 RepID=A0A5B7GB35_PORTR|nr:hypothetical protein [Portunus trituberculatus]
MLHQKAPPHVTPRTAYSWDTPSPAGPQCAGIRRGEGSTGTGQGEKAVRGTGREKGSKGDVYGETRGWGGGLLTKVMEKHHVASVAMWVSC